MKKGMFKKSYLYKAMAVLALAVTAGVLTFGVSAALGSAPVESPPGDKIHPTFTGLTVDGDVGIGTDNPSQMLDIRGNALVTGVLGAGMLNVKYSRLGDEADVGKKIESTAIGYNAKANPDGNLYSTAVGFETTSSGAYSTTIGSRSTAVGSYSVSVGHMSTSDKNHSTTLGSLTQADDQAVALGYGSKATGKASISLGYGALSKKINSIALGLAADADGGSSISVGVKSKSKGENSIAFGRDASAGHEYSVAIGPHSSTTKNHQIVLGRATGGTTPQVYIPGSVGIGTDAPSAKLDVVGGTTSNTALKLRTHGTRLNQSTMLRFSNTTNPNTEGFSSYIAGIRTNFPANGSQALAFGTSILHLPPTEQMRITSTGNVGIGTTSPSAKLHVVGDTNVSGSLLVSKEYRLGDLTPPCTGGWYYSDFLNGFIWKCNQQEIMDIYGNPIVLEEGFAINLNLQDNYFDFRDEELRPRDPVVIEEIYTDPLIDNLNTQVNELSTQLNNVELSTRNLQSDMSNIDNTVQVLDGQMKGVESALGVKF